MAYTTPALVASFLKRDLSVNEQASLAMLIPAIKAWIDLKTSTTFDAAVSSTRLYPGGNGELSIDPCTSITLIEMLDDYGTTVYTYQGYEYAILPANDTVKNMIHFRGGVPSRGANRIRVTAVFSSNDSGVPEDIRMIATRLCALMLNHKVANGLQREALEGHMVQYDITKFATEDPMVMSVLGLHRELLIDDEDWE